MSQAKTDTFHSAMNTTLFHKYQDIIADLPASSIDNRLLLDRDGKFSIYYAPFEYVNPMAKVVLVGITPGRTQMVNALRAAQKQIMAKASTDDVLKAAKQTAGFSGALRHNLVRLLDHIGLNAWLGIRSTVSLFEADHHQIQLASVLRYPVFVDGKDYNGTPSMLRHPLLKRHLLAHFGEQLASHRDAVFVPLGDKPAEALKYLASEGRVDKTQILDGLPHPSGQNSERIAYFLGTKHKTNLSAKTDPDKLDKARTALMAKLSQPGVIGPQRSI